MNDDSVGSLTEHLDRAIPAMMEADGVPGLSIAVIEDGDLVWSSAYGWADIASRIPMTVQTVNRAESISKPVTAVGVMRLVEEGLVGLDDRLVDHVGRWAFPSGGAAVRDITLRQLLSHTAGVEPGSVGVHYPPESEMPTLDENLTHEFGLVHPPGSMFLYSNVGFNLLELLVEEVTGEDFAVYMEREVLEPLGMESAGFVWSEQPATGVPVGYDLDGAPVPIYVYPEKASGGLFASVEDIALFVTSGQTGSRYQARTSLLEPDSLEEMYAPTVEIRGLFRFAADSYGLGHFSETLSDGREVVWHGGQGHGWMTDFHSIPESGDGLVVMANSQRSWPMIAQILADWSDWMGVEPVEFSIVARISAWSRVAAVAAAAVALWLLWRLIARLASGRAALAPLSGRSILARGSSGLLGLVLMALVVWDMSQSYSFFSSILPSTLNLVRASMASLGLVLAVSATFTSTSMTSSPVDEVNQPDSTSDIGLTAQHRQQDPQQQGDSYEQAGPGEDFVRPHVAE